MAAATPTARAEAANVASLAVLVESGRPDETRLVPTPAIFLLRSDEVSASDTTPSTLVIDGNNTRAFESQDL